MVLYSPILKVKPLQVGSRQTGVHASGLILVNMPSRSLLHALQAVSGSHCRICHRPDTGHQFGGVESCGTVIVKPMECRKWLLGIGSTDCSSLSSPFPGLKNGKYSRNSSIHGSMSHAVPEGLWCLQLVIRRLYNIG
jgi:hypothetical protein